MKRLLLVATLAVASAVAASPASAGPVPKPGDPGGYCDGDVDVVCREHACVPDLPCNIEFCGIWMNGACRD